MDKGAQRATGHRVTQSRTGLKRLNGSSSIYKGFPGGSDSKESCLQYRRPKFYPWVRKIPWRREWQLTAVFLIGKFHGQSSLVGYSSWGGKGLDTTEQLTHAYIKM